MAKLTLVPDEDARDELTDRQKEILGYINQSIGERGFPPTLRA